MSCFHYLNDFCLVIIPKTFNEVKKISNLNNYAVKCDTEKYATHVSSDNVLFCWYGLAEILMDVQKQFKNSKGGKIMKNKTYLEENKTIIFNLTNDNKVIVETYDYSNGFEQYSTNFQFYDLDFDKVINLYKSGISNVQ